MTAKPGTTAYICRVRWDADPVWVIFDTDHMMIFERRQTLRYAQLAWRKRWYMPGRWVQYKGIMRPSECRMTVTAARRPAEEKQAEIDACKLAIRGVAAGGGTGSAIEATEGDKP
jgi:hypothetical protein